MADKNENKSQQGIMSQKEFYLKLILSLISIIGCVGMMVSSALAIFVSEIKSDGNKIKSGCFDVVVTSSCGCSGEGAAFTACTTDRDEHSFTIEPDGTVDGYAKIIIEGNGDRVEQYTEQLNAPITVRIAAMPGTKIRFKPFWGKVKNVEPVRALLAKDGTFIYHSLTPVPEEEETTEESVNGATDSSESAAEGDIDDSTESQTPMDENSEETTIEDIHDNSSDVVIDVGFESEAEPDNSSESEDPAAE